MTTRAVHEVLIIGGGFSGMSAAIELRKRGIAVDLCEISRDWRTDDGAGIGLGGASLRILAQIGVLDAVLREGHASDGVDLYQTEGTFNARMPTPRIAAPDIPGSGGIMRPVLARILAEATRALGVNVMLGTTFSAISADDTGIAVIFNSGQQRRYDLVIGADGLYSSTRAAVFPDAPHPHYSGQAVWRMLVPRPAQIERITMWLGGRVKPGVCPVSAEQMYLFVTEHRPDNSHVSPETFAAQLHGLLAGFSDPRLRDIREQIGPDSPIVYRPLETLLLPAPWYRGRVVLIGDSVHATTPHLASGACIGMEDAVVLAEELGTSADLTVALQRFQTRRWERCRLVVENSMRIGELEMQNMGKQEQEQLMRESLHALAEPI